MADASSGGKERSDLAAGCTATPGTRMNADGVQRVRLIRPSTGPTPFGTGMSVDE